MSEQTNEQPVNNATESVMNMDSNFENLSNKLQLSKEIRKKAWDNWLHIVKLTTTDLKVCYNPPATKRVYLLKKM